MDPGAALGEALGDALGAELAVTLGCELGPRVVGAGVVGRCVGCDESWLVGRALGAALGLAVGNRVGDDDGLTVPLLSVGPLVVGVRVMGCAVGSAVLGCLVGCWLGAFDGALLVGLAVVGLAAVVGADVVGALLVGACVAALGALLGGGVGAENTLRTPGLVMPVDGGLACPWLHTQSGSLSSCPLLLPSPSLSSRHTPAHV